MSPALGKTSLHLIALRAPDAVCKIMSNRKLDRTGISVSELYFFSCESFGWTKATGTDIGCDRWDTGANKPCF